MLLFCTKSSSVLEHWKNICEEEEILHVRDKAALLESLKKYPEALVLLHLSFLEKDDFLDVLKHIKTSFSKIKPIVFSDIPTLEEAKPLLLLSIYGYANAYLAPVHLQQILSVARAGSVWLPPELLQQMIQQIPGTVTRPPDFESILTSREMEIARYIAKGHTNKQIAKAAFITEHTVKVHLRSIFEKLDIHDRLSLALKFRNL